MENAFPIPGTTTINAVVRHLGSPDDGVHRLRLLHEHDQVDAWSWLSHEPSPPAMVLKATVGLLPLDESRNPICHVVTRIDPAPQLDVFNLIPDQFGKSEGIVFRCRDVVDACSTPCLRRLLSDAFSIEQVYSYFWTCPASRCHHHAHAGGLADHSVEMAESVRDASRLGDIDRDLGIVLALLHDVGKLWCYESLYSHLEPLGHELVGLAKLHGPIERLAEEWPDGAVALRALLSGQWKRQGGKPLLAIGSLVRALDQTSAEADMRTRANHRHRPWVPDLPPCFDSPSNEWFDEF